MRLKADFQIIRLDLTDLLPASKYQSSLKMLSANSSHSSINEYCRCTAPSALGAKNNLQKCKFIFKILCCYYFWSFYSVYSLQLSLIYSLVQCVIAKAEERKQGTYEQCFQNSGTTQFRRRIHIFINQFDNHSLTIG